MSELTLEKNRPFRVDLENVDFSNIAPDNVDKFKALVKIFDTTMNFTIAEAKEFDSFNAATEAFLNTMTGADIGGVRTRTVEGIVNGNYKCAYLLGVAYDCGNGVSINKELAEERAYTIQMQKQVIENLQQELKQHKKNTQSTMPDVLHQSTR